MATSEWLRFFEDAGIPPGPALGYAVAFVDNRIHKDMLLELTKELMKDLGVTAVGDVIAILRHARLVHRQEMCRAASEALRDQADHRDRDWRDQRDWGHQDHWDQEQREQQDHRDRDPRDQQDHRDWKDRDPRDQRDRDHRDQRDPVGAAGRMIANSLSRDPAPRNPPGAGICVTVPNGAGGSSPTAAPAAPWQRRVTAAAPGRYRIPRISRISRISPPQAAAGRQILRQIPPAAPAPARPSVFERLGAEAKAAAGKPSGVFGRLGAAPESSGDPPGDPSGDPQGDRADPEALPYAGVLKRRRDGSAAMQDGAVSSSSCGSSCASRSSCGSRSVFRRLGRQPR